MIHCRSKQIFNVNFDNYEQPIVFNVIKLLELPGEILIIWTRDKNKGMSRSMIYIKHP